MKTKTFLLITAFACSLATLFPVFADTISGAIDARMMRYPDGQAILFGIYNTKGEWIIEGHGVDPEIQVVDDPGLMAGGGDPQLERAIDEVLKQLRKNPPTEVQKPKYPKRAGKP